MTGYPISESSLVREVITAEKLQIFTFINTMEKKGLYSESLSPQHKSAYRRPQLATCLSLLALTIAVTTAVFVLYLHYENIDYRSTEKVRKLDDQVEATKKVLENILKKVRK